MRPVRRHVRWLLIAGALLAIVGPWSRLPAQVTPGSRFTRSTTTAAPRRTPPLKPAPRPTGDPRLAKFDPATRLLIEMELRDATPADREHWLSLLATVDADQAPHLLSARRRAAGAAAQAKPTSSNQPPAQAGTAPPTTGTPVVARRTTTPTPASVSPASLSAAEPVTPAVAPTAQSLPPTAPLTNAQPTPAPSTSEAAPAPDSASPATPQRRWMAPLRGRWGDARNESESPAAVATVDAPAGTTSTPTQRIDAPSEVRSSAYMTVELQRVMALLRTELVDAEKSGLEPTDPRYRRLHVQMRLLQLLANEPEQALQAIPQLPTEQQEFWTQYLWALANELDAPADQPDSDRLRRTTELLESAERHLRQAAPLAVSKACFCYRINSYGSYDCFDRSEFRAGQPVLVYAEVQNFRSDTGTDGLYRTRIRSLVEVVPAAEAGVLASPVDRREFPATEDASRSLRSDYFHSYRIDLPTQLPAGTYMLRLTITDELSGKSTATTLPFSVR